MTTGDGRAMTDKRLAAIESHLIKEVSACTVAVVGVEIAELLSLIAEVKFWRKHVKLGECLRHGIPPAWAAHEDCVTCSEGSEIRDYYWNEIRKEPRS